MEKQIHRKFVGEGKEYSLSDWTNPVKDSIEIPSLLQLLFESKEKGATHLEVYIEVDYDRDVESIELKPYFNQEETDIEFNARIRANQEFVDRQKDLKLQEERAMYEELKLKFEK